MGLRECEGALRPRRVAMHLEAQPLVGQRKRTRQPVGGRLDRPALSPQGPAPAGLDRASARGDRVRDRSGAPPQVQVVERDVRLSRRRAGSMHSDAASRNGGGWWQGCGAKAYRQRVEFVATE